VFGGGVPHDVRPPKARKDHGTVLFCSSILKPDLSHELRIKPGTEDERQGRCGSFEHSQPKSRDTPVQLQELNHGTVLNTCPSLHPDLSYEGKTNIAGKRETERLGSRGGFTAGVRIWAGGAARKTVTPVPETAAINRGTVLHESATLKPDMSLEQRYKAGTDGAEREGSVGGFQHGGPLRKFSGHSAEKWALDTKQGARRFGQGHYCAGVTQWRGIVPAYPKAHAMPQQ
jgi:hypothetical protein